MALRKNITLPGNVVAAYHRISGVYISDAERLLEVHVQSFRDEETRRETVEGDGGAISPKWAPLVVSPVKVTGPEFTALFGAGVPDYPTKPDLYALLKTLPAFEAAVDA